MVLTNKSSYPDAEIRALAQKVVPYFKHQKLASVLVLDEERWGGIGHGLCQWNTVTVWLPRYTTYPFRDMYRKRAGDRVMQCWQDLFVCILAHELRHVDQNHMDKRPHHYEVDAEKYAFKVFERYRAEIEGRPLDQKTA